MAKRRGEHGGPSMFRVLAVALGVGVASAFVFDVHGHTCAGCGRKWKHLGTFNEGDIHAHTCSRCGKVEWWRDGHGDSVAGGETAPPPALPPGPDDGRT